MLTAQNVVEGIERTSMIFEGIKEFVSYRLSTGIRDIKNSSRMVQSSLQVPPIPPATGIKNPYSVLENVETSRAESTSAISFDIKNFVGDDRHKIETNLNQNQIRQTPLERVSTPAVKKKQELGKTSKPTKVPSTRVGRLTSFGSEFSS